MSAKSPLITEREKEEIMKKNDLTQIQVMYLSFPWKPRPKNRDEEYLDPLGPEEPSN